MAPVGSGGARSSSSTPCQLGLATGFWPPAGGAADGWSRAALAAARVEYRSNAAGPPIGMYPWDILYRTAWAMALGPLRDPPARAETAGAASARARSVTVARTAILRGTNIPPSEVVGVAGPGRGPGCAIVTSSVGLGKSRSQATDVPVFLGRLT